MYVSTPYRDRTVVIDESNPDIEAARRAGVQGLEIKRSLIAPGSRLDKDALNDVVQSVDDPDSIRAFVVDYNSGINSLPDLDRFRNIEYFHVAGRKLKAYQDLTSFPQLKSIFLAGFKAANLCLHPGVNLEYFRSIRGNLKSISFSSKNYWLQSCQKMQWFEDVQGESAWIEGCNSLDLNTLGRIRGLTSLRMSNIKSLDSLSFIEKCKSLEKVSITATAMNAVNVGDLEKSPCLKKLFLGQCSKDRLRAISMSAPSILLSNGDLTIIGGREKQWSYFESV